MMGKPEHLPRIQRRSTYGTYKYFNGYRSEIREDCQYRCVYCDLHERDVGSERSMSIDHFRPKGKYPSLERDPQNLVWSCIECNQRKKDDWPAHGLPSNPTVNGVAGYVDPFVEDRRDYFDVTGDGEFTALKHPAGYMIGFLALNRPLLQDVRGKRTQVYNKLVALREHFSSDLDTFNAVLADESKGEDDKLQWIEDRPRFRAFLETVNLWP